MNSNVQAYDDLNKIQNNIIRLQSVVKESEKYLRAKNLEFKKVSQELNIAGEKITLTEITLQHYKNKVNKDYDDLKKTWDLLVLQQVESHRQVEYVITKNRNLQVLKNKSIEIMEGIQRANLLDVELKKLKGYFLTTKSKADILLELIQKVESHKASVMSKIYVTRGKEKTIENKYIKNNLETIVAKDDFSVQKTFITPLQSYIRAEKSDSGINFFYMNDSVIIAPLHGKIAYIGELSTYGQVIMIEHDQKMMSVLLGDLSSHLKEEEIVTQGSVIGKAFRDSDGAPKSLYYELRKEEKAISTISYLKI